MDINYLQSRLRDSLAQAKSALDSCARIAHEARARGYQSILANYGCEDDATRNVANDRSGSTSAPDLDDATEEWANEGGAGRKQP
jgi:hypothetical protein